jgi:hypothetical protein
MGESRFGALKRAMGLSGGARTYFLSQFLAFLADFPDFSESEVYSRTRVERFEVNQVLRFQHGPHEYRFRVVEVAADGRPKRLTLAL